MVGFTRLKNKKEGRFIPVKPYFRVVDMPITREEALRGRIFKKEKESIDTKKIEILNFLKENKKDAWSFMEIYRGIKGLESKILPIIESVLELLVWSAEKEQYFEALLDLIEEEKVLANDVKGELFYAIAG